jgi:hypothetical protein
LLDEQNEKSSCCLVIKLDRKQAERVLKKKTLPRLLLRVSLKKKKKKKNVLTIETNETEVQGGSSKRCFFLLPATQLHTQTSKEIIKMLG